MLANTTSRWTLWWRIAAMVLEVACAGYLGHLFRKIENEQNSFNV